MQPDADRALQRVGPRRRRRAFYRDDWRAAQRTAVESVCDNADIPVWVASEEGRIAGFVALRLHPEDQMGQIYMIAVDPDFQRRGIAARLITHSFDWFKEAGMSIAMVETGVTTHGEHGHHVVARFRPVDSLAGDARPDQ